MTHRRRFTAEFKAQIVLELLSGAKSSAEVCREHQIAPSVLADWKTIFLARAASVFESPEHRSNQDGTRVAELERLLGRLTLEHDILQKATTILHHHSKTSGRSCRCLVNTILYVKCAVYWGGYGAVITTKPGLAMRRH